jgi:hypothetical protein
VDDLEWDEWMKLTDDQQEAIIDREMKELEDALEAMTVPQQVAHHRHFCLLNIVRARKFLRNPEMRRVEVIDEHFKGSIKRSQVRLLKLRSWRATGTYPGEG